MVALHQPRHGKTSTGRVLASRLQENTGSYVTDSGGIYGRHWQRNQGRNFEAELAATLDFRWGKGDCTMSVPTQRQIEDALSVLRADYWEDVKNAAAALKEAIDAGEVTSREQADDYLWETVDGSSRVTYTRGAILCLLFSSNDEEGPSEFGGEQFIKDGAVDYSGLAFHAFMADVREQAEREGLFDFDTDEDEEEEEDE